MKRLILLLLTPSLLASGWLTETARIRYFDVEISFQRASDGRQIEVKQRKGNTLLQDWRIGSGEADIRRFVLNQLKGLPYSYRTGSLGDIVFHFELSGLISERQGYMAFKKIEISCQVKARNQEILLSPALTTPAYYGFDGRGDLNTLMALVNDQIIAYLATLDHQQLYNSNLELRLRGRAYGNSFSPGRSGDLQLELKGEQLTLKHGSQTHRASRANAQLALVNTPIFGPDPMVALSLDQNTYYFQFLEPLSKAEAEKRLQYLRGR